MVYNNNNNNNRHNIMCLTFRCWCNATTLSCYMISCQPWLHGPMIRTKLCIILTF